LFERLQQEQPGAFPDGQRRTLQRRLKEWRRDLAHKLVFGVEATGETKAKSSGPVKIWPRICQPPLSTCRGDKWHLDEVVISIAGKKDWLWRVCSLRQVRSDFAPCFASSHWPAP
jgi:hypothetical protein